MKRDLKNKNVFITGASAGIGAALAKLFVMRGAGVAIVARRGEKLQEFALEIGAREGQVLPVICDVTDLKSLQAAIEAAHAHFGKIDIVIANAGFNLRGKFESLSVDDYRRQFDTNIFGVLNTAKASLECLKASRGQLVIIGSVKSHLALPGHSAYAMSKFAVRALALSLRGELRPYGISVTLVSPGFVASEIRRVNKDGQLQSDEQSHVPRWLVVPAATAARDIVRGILSKKTEHVVTFHGKFVVFMARHFPTLTAGLGCFLTTRYGVKRGGKNTNL